MIRPPAVREVIDLICEKVDAIEMSYPRRTNESATIVTKASKILTIRLAWLGHILGREYGPLISNPPRSTKRHDSYSTSDN